MYENEAYAIVGAALEVHDNIGCGFSEKVYQDALEVEFNQRGIPYQRETPYHVTYKGVTLKSEFIPDFVCFGKIIVELKSVREVDDVFKAQAINYGKVSGFKLAMLLNFGTLSLETQYFPIKKNL